MRVKGTPLVLALIFACPVQAGEMAPRYIVDVNTAGKLAGTGFWRPDSQQVADAEANLRQYLTATEITGIGQNTDAPGQRSEQYRTTIGQQLDTYVLQFAGVRKGQPPQKFSTEGNGPKQIAITGICKAIATGMKAEEISTRLAMIADGGSCIFEALYDVESRQIVSFSVRGR